MDKQKLNAILSAMEAESIPQIIISDPAVIFYLTGAWIHPGERLLVLYLNQNGNHRLLVNDLFRQTKDLGVEIQYYNDIQDGVEILSRFMDPAAPVAIDKSWPARFLLRLQGLNAASSYVNSSAIVDGVRQIKTPEEQEKMRIASRLNDGVMDQLVGILSEGHTELELKDILAKLYAGAGCQGFSFDPITAFAGNAADPHHEPDGSRGKYGDCVVLDIGGLKDDYCSDMTRTVFLGTVSDRQREIYEVVLEANRRGIAAAKPGNRMKDVDDAARSYIEERGFGKYFTHRTGHSIGLEVHEAGDVSAVNESIIRPGQCFSVEPGIYIPEENIGVRIEDLVLITKDGCEVLNHYPKELRVVPFPAEK
ncbi:MAG: Xaa-Pro peptidase family protein [Eubacteriales bacterium]|nr:Xaa-Pro peptidase family protein [Eubacteriales bacterium]